MPEYDSEKEESHDNINHIDEKSYYDEKIIGTIKQAVFRECEILYTEIGEQR